MKQIQLILKGVLKEGGKPIRYVFHKPWNVVENGSMKKVNRVPYYRGSCAGEKVCSAGVADPRACKCHLTYHAVITG